MGKKITAQRTINLVLPCLPPLPFSHGHQWERTLKLRRFTDVKYSGMKSSLENVAQFNQTSQRWSHTLTTPFTWACYLAQAGFRFTRLKPNIRIWLTWTEANRRRGQLYQWKTVISQQRMFQEHRCGYSTTGSRGDAPTIFGEASRINYQRPQLITLSLLQVYEDVTIC